MHNYFWHSGGSFDHAGGCCLHRCYARHDQAYKSLDMQKKAHSEHQQTRRDKEQMSRPAKVIGCELGNLRATLAGLGWYGATSKYVGFELFWGVLSPLVSYCIFKKMHDFVSKPFLMVSKLFSSHPYSARPSLLMDVPKSPVVKPKAKTRKKRGKICWTIWR